MNNALPPRWRITTLGQHFVVLGGGTPSRAQPEYWNGDIPWASVKDLGSRELMTTEETITREGLENSASRLISPGRVIVATRMSLGKAAITRVPVAINQDLKALEPKSSLIEPRYLYWYLMSQSLRLGQAGIGATVRGLSTDYIRNLPIPIPPSRAVQTRIADLLDLTDLACALRAESDKEATSLVTSVFHQMFGPSGQNTHKWPVEKLEAYADITSGIQLSPRRSAGAGIPYLRVANVYRNGLDLSDIKRMVVSVGEIALKGLKAGDILVVEGHGNAAELGRAAVWTGEIEPCVHQNHLIRIRVDHEVLLPDYTSYLLNSAYGRDYFLRHGRTTSGLNTISTSVVRSLPIFLPPIELQAGFASIAQVNDTQNRIRCAQKEDLDKLRESLLFKLFPRQITNLEELGQVESPRPYHGRFAWAKLSGPQQTVWDATQSHEGPFSIEDLTERVRLQFGQALSRELLITMIEILVSLGVLIKEGRVDADLWRRPDAEEDREVEV